MDSRKSRDVVDLLVQSSSSQAAAAGRLIFMNASPTETGSKFDISTGRVPHHSAQLDPTGANEKEIPTTNASGSNVQHKRLYKKPSSNFTIIERTFILMAIAAVRSDPKWRTHNEPTNPDAIKDFTVPFCNAVRQKLMQDPDFRGRLAVDTLDRDGKCTQSPSKESIIKIWQNLYINGSLTRPQTNLGRKKDLAAEERVKQYLLQNPNCKMSSRAIAAQTDTSHRNVIRILRQENLALRKSKFKRPSEPTKEARWLKMATSNDGSKR